MDKVGGESQAHQALTVAGLKAGRRADGERKQVPAARVEKGGSRAVSMGPRAVQEAGVRAAEKRNCAGGSREATGRLRNQHRQTSPAVMVLIVVGSDSRKGDLRHFPPAQ